MGEINMYIKILAKSVPMDRHQMDHMRINSDHVINYSITFDALTIVCLNETVRLSLEDYNILEGYDELMKALPSLASVDDLKELSQPKLLPCPMCGSKAGMTQVPDGYKAGCSRCHITTHSLKDEYSALVYWNYMIGRMICPKAGISQVLSKRVTIRGIALFALHSLLKKFSMINETSARAMSSH